MVKLTGSCLCGAARIEAEGEIIVTGDCFCVDCRKSSGTAHCTHVTLPDDKFDVTGETAVYERPADSGNVVSRFFCPTCGAPLYSRNSGIPGSVFLRVSCLDDLNAVTPAMSVYTSRAPDWARINPNGPAFPEMPPASEMPVGADGAD